MRFAVFLKTSLSESGIYSGATSCTKISSHQKARPALSTAGPPRRCIRHFLFFLLSTDFTVTIEPQIVKIRSLNFAVFGE
jgi:hypothetical protein